MARTINSMTIEATPGPWDEQNGKEGCEPGLRSSTHKRKRALREGMDRAERVASFFKDKGFYMSLKVKVWQHQETGNVNNRSPVAPDLQC